MKKFNKFMALLVVFTSIASFLSIGLNGQSAKADTNAEGTDIQVSVTGSKDLITPRTDDATKQIIYATDNVVNGFDVTVKDVSTTSDALGALAMQTMGSQTGIVKQQVDIVKVDGAAIGTQQFADMGMTIGDYQRVNGATKSVGKTINNVPLGANKVEYKITITIQTAEYVPAVKDGNGQITTPATYTLKAESSTVYANQEITIDHATTFIVGKVDPMVLKAYIGKQALSAFDDKTDQFIGSENDKENNGMPFLYSEVVKPDDKMALRYIFDVPDSVDTLKYGMTFNNLSLDNAKVFKNGTEAQQGAEYNIDGQVLTGKLQHLGDSDTIVVKLNGANEIQKAYAIEIRYKTLSWDKDYTMVSSGISKLNYDSNSDVQAYIGKKFDISYDQSGFQVFKGNIYIDKRAGMVSIKPLLECKNTVAYVVTNNYTDSSGNVQQKKSVDKNGKQFIDYMAGSKNQLQVDAYALKNDGTMDSSKLLARYLLDVNLLESQNGNFKMDLSLGTTGAAAVYLTQPGVKENVIDKFSTDRRTYDLYYGAPDVDSVNVAFTGTRSNLNEYIRVWLADDVESNNLQEAQASKDNQQVNMVRNTELDVKVGTAKKMVVQAYYDEFEYKTDTNGNYVLDVNGNKMLKVDSDGNPIYTSHALGDTYVFYLPENFVKETDPNQGQTSNNALLNSLKIKGYTLKNSSGNTGFSSDAYDYSTTVNKEDTTEKLTVVAKDDNIKSIVATINGGTQTYTLASGDETELPLDSSGTTTIKIVVTAQDGKTTATYTVTISNNTKGSAVNLKDVILNTGDYTFDSSKSVNDVRVDPNITSIKVTPIPEDPQAKVSVNGDEYTDTPIAVSLKGEQKTEISIEVTSDDGTKSKTYTLEVYRVDASSWDNNNNDTSASDDDQYYDDFNDCWIDTSKYEEWGTVNGKPVYFDKHNRQVKDAWIYTGYKYYYLNNLGYRASGWKVDDTNGKVYYLDAKTGEMRTGWINVNNTWFYLDPTGPMHKGWLYLNKKWYYFMPNGQMVINQSMFVDDKECTFGQDGVLIS